MTLNREDLDFIDGFVKCAYAMGATEEQASVMLQVGYDQWKTMTDGERSLNELKKLAFAQAARTAGRGLLNLTKGTAGMIGHGLKNVVGKPLGAAIRNPLRTAAVAGTGALGYGAYKGIDTWKHRNDNVLDARGFAPGTDLPGVSNSQYSDSGDGSYAASRYSPHGAALQSKLDNFESAGAVSGMSNGSNRVPTTPGTALPTKPSGTRWDQTFQDTRAQAKQYQDRATQIQNQITNLPNSGLDPIAQERQMADLTSQLSSAQMQADSLLSGLGAKDQSFQAQEAQYDQARTTNQAHLAKQIAMANDQARIWAARQAQARTASGFIPKALYGARNWLTGDTQEQGDNVSQRLAAMRAAQEKLNAQPENYYHNN
jgi:hypothetical protein